MAVGRLVVDVIFMVAGQLAADVALIVALMKPLPMAFVRNKLLHAFLSFKQLRNI